MGTISYGIPQSGLPNASEDVKVATALTQLLTLVNGNIDGTNIAATLAQSAGVNGASVVKGACANVGPGTRTNVVYGALNDAPDQVAGIVLPTNGLIAVWYQATWQQSTASTARAAIFLAGNQLQGSQGGTSPLVQEASMGGGTTASNSSLATSANGLTSAGIFGYTGDVTTGQIVTSGNGGGPCYIFAAAGTYTVSVQFKSSSGTVTASNRRLWVEAISFA